MDIIHTCNGYLGDVILVAVVAFLIFLAAFIALNVAIACRYHATKHAYAREACRLQNRVTATGTPRDDHITAAAGNTR